MSRILLANPELPAEYIDLSVGEAHVVRETLESLFDIRGIDFNTSVLTYPPTHGYKPLVSFLEDKHNAPVIITNGAQQGCAAAFYALNRLNHRVMGMRSPYWAIFPTLLQMHGFQFSTGDKYHFNYDSYLLTLPNNPDNYYLPPSDLLKFASELKDRDIPLIHDAAYYTNTYLPNDYPLYNIGDMQIYSFSKMFGLSGARVGYIVFNNREYYNYVSEYVEYMTVGVSLISQMFILDLLKRVHVHQILKSTFESISKSKLLENYKIIQDVPTSIMEVSENTCGMFGWYKIKDINAFKQAKINVVSGDSFGDSDYIRINLAATKNTLLSVVNRLKYPET
jgi:aspartate/methionine/tyrosine aminotransferase